MLKINILNACPGDESQIITLLRETWLATYPNKEHNITKEDILKKDWDSKDRLEKWKKVIAENGKNNIFNFVAKENDKFIGFCQIVRGVENNELKIIYVLPDYQRKGIGRMLLDKARLMLDPAKDTIVEVVAYNNGAINFYQKIGFVKFESGNGHEFSHGKMVPTIRMKLKR